MYNRKAFKQEAKQLIRASKPHYMLVTLVFFLLTTALSILVSELSNISGFGAGILSVFLSILVTLFTYVMSVGYSNYSLRLSRGQETGMKSLFESFSFAGRSIALPILTSIYIFAWSFLLMFALAIVLVILGLVFGAADLVAGEISPLFIVVAAVLYVVALVFVIILSLRYSMASFALVDDPDDGASAAIRRSVKMMRGNKGKLFVMQLSFIGWEILLGLISMVVLTVGFFVGGATWVFDSLSSVMDQPDQIMLVMDALSVQMSLWTILAEIICLPLSLWLIPYRQTAYARFYNHVSGYDYYIANRDKVQEQEQIPVAVSAPVREQSVPEQPVQAPRPPVGGYYTPPAAPEEEKPLMEESEEPEEL